MSTRATYGFPNVVFYVHYDGYPKGAATYFREAIADRNKRGGMAMQFARQVGVAEFTESHELHGDTEYQYQIDGYDNVSWRGLDGEGEWAAWHTEPLEVFISRLTPDDEPVLKYDGKVMTASAALDSMNQERLQFLMYVGEYGVCGNAKFGLEDWLKKCAVGCQHLNQILTAKLEGNPPSEQVDVICALMRRMERLQGQRQSLPDLYREAELRMAELVEWERDGDSEFQIMVDLATHHGAKAYFAGWPAVLAGRELVGHAGQEIEVWKAKRGYGTFVTLTGVSPATLWDWKYPHQKHSEDEFTRV